MVSSFSFHSSADNHGGCLGVYDVRNPIRQRQSSVRPQSYFPVHQAGVSGIAWVAIPEHDSKTLGLRVDKDLTQLVTSGYDGSIFISDLRIAGSGNNGGTSMFDHSRSALCCMMTKRNTHVK